MSLEVSDTVKQLLGIKREQCAKVALAARLPKGYQWGRDAMEQFNFGKQRAATAIMALNGNDTADKVAASLLDTAMQNELRKQREAIIKLLASGSDGVGGDWTCKEAVSAVEEINR